MQNFELTSSMLTMGGGFYPTGYVFAMFPSMDDARKVVSRLPTEKHEKPTLLLPPETVLNKLGHTLDAADSPLPSVGTEGATVRHYAELASEGHCALMVYAPTAKDTEAVMEVVRSVPFSCATKYRHLVIEDLS